MKISPAVLEFKHEELGARTDTTNRTCVHCKHIVKRAQNNQIIYATNRILRRICYGHDSWDVANA
jgi:hypothetical protein